jgi:hypothetical protein
MLLLQFEPKLGSDDEVVRLLHLCTRSQTQWSRDRSDAEVVCRALQGSLGERGPS